MREDVSVVLVSNRGPISFVREADGFGIKRGAGGLAGALDPVARGLGDRAIWIAAATSEVERAALAAGAGDGLDEQLGYNTYLLEFDPDVYSGYYDIVSNRMLWFANHCLWDELDVHSFGREELDAWQKCYLPVNARFAQAVLEIADPDSLILFQDYHLTTAPANVRMQRPQQPIFHFTHSSVCGPEGLDVLPAPIPRTVVEGMLGADLLGFHVPHWSEGFMRCAELIGAKVDRSKGLIDHDGGRTWVRSYPIPIDVAELREQAASEPVRVWAKRFSEENPGPIVARADRIEPSKNIVRGFEAFGLVLDRREELRDKARFVACLYPSRQSMEEYKRYSDEVEAAAQRVNESHPGAIDLFAKDDYDRTLGALIVYDVLLVNSIMDGMNLVSKEGPAVNEQSGVLVLSKGTGSYDELGEFAIAIDDAYDVTETADAIERALDLGEPERREKATALRKKVEAAKPETWIETQIEDLVAVQSGEEPVTPPDAAGSS